MLTIGLYYEVIEGKGQEFEEKFFSVVELLNTRCRGFQIRPPGQSKSTSEASNSK